MNKTNGDMEGGSLKGPPRGWCRGPRGGAEGTERESQVCSCLLMWARFSANKMVFQICDAYLLSY